MAEKAVTTLPLVIIQWKDHNTNDDWYAHKDARAEANPMIMSSVGWLVHETDEVYQLASLFSHDDGNLSMLTNIVKSAVVRTINVPQPKRRRKK